MHTRALTLEERQAIHRILWTGKHFEEFRRAFVIHFSSLGLEPKKIAQLAQYDLDTVEDIIHYFNLSGMDSIFHPPPHPGTDGSRPPVLSNGKGPGSSAVVSRPTRNRTTRARHPLAPGPTNAPSSGTRHGIEHWLTLNHMLHPDNR